MLASGGSILAIRGKKKSTSRRSRRGTQSQNVDEPTLQTVLVSKIDTTTSSEVDIVYNSDKASEKNSSESIVSLQQGEYMPIVPTDQKLYSPDDAHDDSPDEAHDNAPDEAHDNALDDAQAEFKEEVLLEEGEEEDQSQSTDDESEESEDDDVNNQRTIKKLKDTNFFESCQVNVPYQNQQQIPLYLVPIDFYFKNGKLKEQELSVTDYNNARKSLPKEQRKKLTKKTPKIFYLRTFDRDEYEEIRQRMRRKIPLGDLKCISKKELKTQLILYPECFLLVQLSKKHEQLMENEFDKALFYEIIQHRKLPEEIDFDRSYLDQTFEPNNERSWFKIDESQIFHPETGKYDMNKSNDMNKINVHMNNDQCSYEHNHMFIYIMNNDQ